MKVTDFYEKPTYGYRKVTNYSAIKEWARTQGLTETIAGGDMHVTFVYSKAPIARAKLFNLKSNSLHISSGGERSMELFGKENNLLVIRFEDEYLASRHAAAKAIGSSWDWDGFTPHISISYDFSGDVSLIEPYQGDIILGPEILQDMDDNWSAKE